MLISFRIIFILLLYFTIALTQQIDIQSVNSTNLGLYEKFEINISLTDATYSNPYDPEQIDIIAVMTAPSGKTWEIFGFYDNYQSRNQWKIRFAPNEIGLWSYYLKATDTQISFESPQYQFTATESNYHGWIKVSIDNPHYFVHDDETPFYGIGPFFPWNVSNGSNGLEKLEASGANLFGYWNIMYDTGEIIESLNSGIGRYDQPKCGRIDQVLGWAEDRDLKMMLSIWPHDLLSNSVWVHQWHQNPYKDICTVEEFFESESAWNYQKKQYRYIIARWGYSRSMGIWEIVNEINGTDGWEVGKTEEALLWVKRVHNYFKANDPMNRPTTASKSGGHYWPEGYAEVDVPNVHVYETGWAAQYPGNPLRSSLWVYYNLSTNFWNDFDKPAIFGEAGYTNSFGNYEAGSEGYLSMFHNALWVSWAGGMSCTPIWWSFGSRELMTDKVMLQMLSFSKITKDFNYLSDHFSRSAFQIENTDLFIMQGEQMMFGWVREIYGNSIGSKQLAIPSLKDTTLQITWFDTWTGAEIKSDFTFVVDSQLVLNIPDVVLDKPDVAFIIKLAEEGIVPAKLKLQGSSNELKINSEFGFKINCFILDAENRFCGKSDIPVQFSLDGPGELKGNTNVLAKNGKAEIEFFSNDVPGLAQIIVQSVNMQSDTIVIQISDKIFIDDFEIYQNSESLQYAWFTKSGTPATVSLDKIDYFNGTQALKMEYDIGNGNAPYAGIFRKLDENYSNALGLSFWLKPDNSKRPLAILLSEKNDRYWRYDYELNGNSGQFFRIPFSDFRSSDSTLEIDLSQLDEISFNVLKGDVDFGNGNISLDDVAMYMTLNATSLDNSNINVTDRFILEPNYPNPFNNSTTISYYLPSRSMVQVNVYNLQGQLVDTLLNKNQDAGYHKVLFQADNLASGVFIYSIKAGKKVKSQKCLLIK